MIVELQYTHINITDLHIGRRSLNILDNHHHLKVNDMAGTQISHNNYNATLA